MLVGDRAASARARPRCGGEVERRDRRGALAFAREREQIRDGAREALGLALAGLEVAAQRLVLGLQPGRLEAQPQAGERRAQLLRGVGDEVALGGRSTGRGARSCR